MTKKKQIENKGFTIIELIIVLAIIAVLLFLAVPRFIGYTKDAKVTSMHQDVKVLEDVAEIHYVEENGWPVEDSEEVAYLGVGGVDEILPIDKEKIQGSVKNINGEYDDYFISISGEHEGKVFHKDGLENQAGAICYGIDVEIKEEDVVELIEEPGVELVYNGKGKSKDNTNFSKLDYDKKNKYRWKPSFSYQGEASNRIQDKIIPVNTDLTYRMTYMIKGSPATGSKAHGLVVPVDIDEKEISPLHTMYHEGTLTTLRQDLEEGDTVVYLANADNWVNSAGNKEYNRRFIFWNYIDSRGNEYPAESYSRNGSDINAWSDGAVNFKRNTITLNKPWTGETIPAGTELSNGSNGRAYKNIAGSDFVIPKDWEEKTGKINGVDYSGKNKAHQFPPATNAVKLGWHLNKGGSPTTKTSIADISFIIEN